jgi:phenylalanyl-tRNA synthetase beta chain
MTGKYFDILDVQKPVDFYVIKGVAEEILDFLGYSGRYSFIRLRKELKEFHPGQTAEISVNNDIVGVCGRLHPENYKEPVFVMEINLSKLLEKKTGKMAFKEISKFPVSSQDIAIIVDKNVDYKDIEQEIKKAGGKLFLSSKVFDVYEGINIGLNKKSVAISLTFGANDRTLTDEEIAPVMKNIIERLEKQLGAELRK